MEWSFLSVAKVQDDSLDDEANEEVPNEAADQPNQTGDAIQQDVLSICRRTHPVTECIDAEIEQDAEWQKRKVQEDGPPCVVGSEIHEDRPSCEQ